MAYKQSFNYKLMVDLNLNRRKYEKDEHGLYMHKVAINTIMCYIRNELPN